MWHLREKQNESNTVWIDFNTYWTLPIVRQYPDTKSMCENAKWHLWAAMTATWHAGEMQLTLIYNLQLTYYELVMDYFDLWMTMKYFSENPMYHV